jgi:hypothetical protein
MFLAGLAAGFLCIIKPTFLILLPLFALYRYWGNLEDRKLTAISALLFLAAFTAIFSVQIWYNSYRFSSVSTFGYTKASFSSPFYNGLWGLLLSPGKSFFVYSPVVVLFFFSIKRFLLDHKKEGLLFISIIILMIGVYCRWNVWSGDLCWGPRFLLVLIPFFMIPTAYIFEELLLKRGRIKLAIVSILVLGSILIQVPAIAVHYLHFLNYFKRNVSFIPPPNQRIFIDGEKRALGLRDHYIDFQFIPEFSPVLGQWWVFKNLIFKNKEAFQNTPWKGLGFNKFHFKERVE